MRYRVSILPLALLMVLGMAPAKTAELDGAELAITYPEAPMPPADRLIPPPQENPYFFNRADGQPYMLQTDLTVNFTSALNQFYYDPRWRGEVWSPFVPYEIPEKGVRMMATWREYDEFSEWRIFNQFHKFFERYTGYGGGGP